MRCFGCNMNNESEEEKKEKLNTHTPKNKIQTKSEVNDKLRKMKSNLIVTICQPRVGSIRRFSREDRIAYTISTIVYYRAFCLGFASP